MASVTNNTPTMSNRSYPVNNTTLQNAYAASIRGDTISNAFDTTTSTMRLDELHIGNEVLKEQDLKALKRFLLEHYPEEYV